MTIRKGKPLPLEKPSNMQRVLLAVGHGSRTRRAVMEETKLQEGQVRAALHNLVFIGLLHRHRDEHGLEEQPSESLGVGVEPEAVALLRPLLDVAGEDRDEEGGQDRADRPP